MITSSAYSAHNAVKSIFVQSFIEEEIRQRTEKLEENIRELKEQNAYLLNLHTEKNDWLQMLVHDLKNPLASIMLAGSFLEKYWQKMSLSEFSKNTASIQANASRMNTIIGRVLSIGAMESGALDLAMDHINVSKLLSVSAQEYANRAASKNISIVVENADSDAFIYADRCALVEIIDNLLSNAIKYSPHNTTIRLRTLAGTEGKTVRLEFHDQGPGIKSTEFGKLFTKFARLSSTPTGGEDSNGLGLAVVHKLAVSMQGKVWCESEYGLGSSFFVEFPLSQPKQYLDVVDTATNIAHSSILEESNKLPLPIAISGYDTVNYFLAGSALLGNPAISAEWNGKMWHFSQEYHRELFLADPTRYVPKYQGFCALGMSRNLLGLGDPEVWSIVDNELFFAYSLEVWQVWKDKQLEFKLQVRKL